MGADDGQAGAARSLAAGAARSLAAGSDDVRISVSVSRALHERMRLKAASADRSLSNWMRVVFAEATEPQRARVSPSEGA